LTARSDTRPPSDAQVALLGLLSERPMHAWEIERTVKYRDMRFWTTLSQSGIYRHLAALEKDDRVSAHEETHDGRLRKVHAITPAGREALLGRLRELLREPQHQKWRVDLATYNVDLLPPEEAVACLERYRKRLAEHARGYRELDEFLAAEGCPAHRRAVARRPLRLIEGELTWVDEFLEELRQA
jgi:DNA-binding PadR family transcriptional regulator